MKLRIDVHSFFETLTVRLFVIFCLAAAVLSANALTTYARDRRPNYGRIEISTTPGGYPLLIDGKPAGETTESPRLLDLSPGPHVIEIRFPNGSNWVREFNIVAGRVNCVVLSYRSTPVTIEQSPCPYPVNVSAPEAVNDGDTITFASDVNYGGTSALTFTWTVSPPSARILSGAGTPTITVDSTGLEGQNITAILVVDDGSGDPVCRQTARAVTRVIVSIPQPRLPVRFDEFPSIAFDDDKARLDNFAIELQNSPGAVGYIYAYGGRRSRPGQADRLGARSRDYLVTQRGLDPSRLVIIDGGYREQDYFELWIVPQGVQPPSASPTVQPSDVAPRPATPRRRRR